MVVRWDVNETSAATVAAAGIIEDDDDDDDEESPRVVEYGRNKVAGVRKRGATSVVAPAAPAPRPTLGRRTVSVKKINVPPGDIDRGTLMMMQHRRGSVISSIAHPQMAQSNYAKLQQSVRHLLGGADRGISSGEYSERSSVDDSSRRKSKQRYRIRSVDHDMTWLDASDHAVIEMIKNYFKWTFLSSFVTVMLSACLAYVTCCMFFAVCIYGLMRQHPQCFVGAGGPGVKVYFMDAYHLSWTTFSTVGYGLIGPAVGTLPFAWYVSSNIQDIEIFPYDDFSIRPYSLQHQHRRQCAHGHGSLLWLALRELDWRDHF
jgi:hypothetical protein